MRAMITFIPLILMVSIMSEAGQNREILGTFGATYQIVEPDALEEIKKKADRVDWQKVFRNRLRKNIQNFRPPDIASLPKAERNREFIVNPAYILDYDVPAAEGVVYPAGFSYNPLDYISLSNVLVVLNASDKEQVEWLMKSKHAEDMRTIVLVTGGHIEELTTRLKKPVYYLTERLAKRLGLRAVPSIVEQDERSFKVREIDVEVKNSAD
ncbi:MAG: hypothetical protein ACNS63_09485 [Candidatus Nitrospinota bacterium M3_3B_026]